MVAPQEGTAARSHALAKPSVTRQEVGDAVREASRYLQGMRQDPARALTVLEPYRECEEFSECTPDEARKLRSIVCVVIADCYRELGQVRTAAEWYRRGGRSFKGGGLAFLYADMVIQHQLQEFYDDALDWLEKSQAIWQATPLITRVFYHVITCWWLYPSQWRMRFRERQLIREMRALVSARERMA